MELSRKSPTVNYILYICNAVFSLLGFLLAIIGIVMIEKIGEFTKYPNASSIKTLPTLFVVLGFFIVAIAIIGSFGVYVENTTFLIIYAGATFILFILQMAMILWVFLNTSEYAHSMSDLVLKAWSQNNLQNNYPMDILQIQFDCCGRYGAMDYINADLNIPNSCCGDWILVNCPDKVYLTKPGCLNEFYKFWTGNNIIVAYSGIILVVAQLVALTSSFHFVKALRSNSSYAY